MVKRMLIDAAHAEETRVVVINGNRLEEFDFETSTKKQIKGNIYLAKVTRVEPSLAAAFVDYGGNRHGFLAFNEIHPDYYRLPIADREKLLAESKKEAEEDAAAGEQAGAGGNGEDTSDGESGGTVETLGGDEIDDIRPRRSSARRYQIQEVIGRRQILLVQVTKEERGNKGAALTTYLSLAGRYCVLMPNATRGGGGISRKITNPAARKKLKAMLESLKAPEGMGVIVRTAGLERSKAEIKRDYEYLSRLWSEIRERTLESQAPALIHEEGSLIKRSLRDVYTRDIDEVVVEGDEGYRVAKDFMRQLIPSHAKRVQPYKDSGIPMLHRYQIEGQLDSIHNPDVQLKSGGYIVINPTEALVAIDVNSGRSTRERNIEETALKTNLEAADEVARQLRLRDLAGLIVIDFIDMEVSRNNAKVERRLKDAMRNDRARIQLGRISPFGLLELSRQRLRPSLIEVSSNACPTCGGSGAVRSTESTVLHVLRAIEEEGMRERTATIVVYVPTLVAIYLLNQKRATLIEIEGRYDLRVIVQGDDSLVPPNLRIERGDGHTEAGQPEGKSGDGQEAAGRGRRRRGGRRQRGAKDEPAAETAQADGETQEHLTKEDGDEEVTRKPRRRGRRGGRRRGRRTGKDEKVETGEPIEAAQGSNGDTPVGDAPVGDAPVGDTSVGDTSVGDTSVGDTPATDQSPVEDAPGTDAAAHGADTPGDGAAPDQPTADRPRRRRRPRRAATKPASETEAAQGSVDDAPATDDAPSGADVPGDGAAPARPRRPRRPRRATAKPASEKADKADKSKKESQASDTAGASGNGAGSDTPASADRTSEPTSDNARRGWWKQLLD